MTYKTFKEFVVLKETTPQQPMNTMQSSSPQHKAQIIKNLMALQKTPPSGVNPQQMQNNIKNAINVTKTSNVSNTANAIDTGKAISTLQQQ